MKSLIQIQTELFYDRVLSDNTEKSLIIIRKHIEVIQRMLRNNENGEIEAERGHPFTCKEIEKLHEELEIAEDKFIELSIK